MARPDVPLEPLPRLYISDPDLARALLPADRVREWPEISKLLEADGFPPVDRLLGGRYVPAVRAWLDRRHGLAAPTAMPADGVEEFGSWRKANRRA